LIVTSHDNSALCQASLDNVSVHIFGGNIPPTVNITSPSNGATFTAPANITINASATDSDGTVSRVDFYNGSILIGTDSTAPYSFDFNNVVAGSYALTARAVDNLDATATSPAVNVSVTSPGSTGFADNFNDNSMDQSKWTFGTIQGAIYTGPSAWDPTVPVLESNQRLVISPRANVTGDHYNGYVSAATWNFTNARAAVEVVQIASGGTTNTELALCVDRLNFLMISTESGILRFEQVVNGTRSATSTAYNAAQHRFWRIRHDLASDAVHFETSVDGVTWTIRRSVTRQLPITAMKIEISAGTWQGLSSPGTAIFDNFTLDTSTGGPVNIPPTVSITSPANGTNFTAPANVVINATANDTDGTINRVDFYSGTTLIGSDTLAPYSFTWNGVAIGSYVLTAKAIDNAGAETTSNPISITVTGGPSLPAPWLRSDIGSVGQAGDATFASGVFSVRGSGADIWDNADAFQYVYQPLNGNGQIIARVTGVQFTDEWAKAGVMIRETLTPGSRHASMFLSAGNGLAFQRRTTTAGLSDHTTGGIGTAPYWVRLVRNGNQISAYRSTDGVTWIQVGSTITINMSTNVFIGLAVTSHNNSISCVATFDNVSVTTGTRILNQ
jgi:regulation of enolase protein 1 (concanavalin A-like superfamily)